MGNWGKIACFLTIEPFAIPSVMNGRIRYQPPLLFGAGLACNLEFINLCLQSVGGSRRRASRRQNISLCVSNGPRMVLNGATSLLQVMTYVKYSKKHVDCV